MRRAVAAVFIGPDAASSTLAGSAIPLYTRDVGGVRTVTLLTCLHVVWPTGPAPAGPLWVGLPIHDDDPTHRVAARLRPPAWGGPPAGTAPGAAITQPVGADWAILDAALPDVVPASWGPLDLVAAEEAFGSAANTPWFGRGFPATLNVAAAALEGVVVGRHALEGAVVAQLRVDKGANALDPKGLSGGPVYVGDAVVGMFVAAHRHPSGAGGNTIIGGIVYAVPLARIIAAAAAAGHLPDLPPPRAVPFPGLLPDALARLTAAADVYSARDGADRAALDELVTAAWQDAGTRTDPPVGPGAFLQAAAYLANRGDASTGSLLGPFLVVLAARLGAARPWLAALLPGDAPAAPAPAAEAPAEILAVEILPLGDGKATHTLVLRQRPGAEWPELRRAEAPPGPGLAQAVADLLAPALEDLPVDVRVQVWAPPELIGLPYDEALVTTFSDATAALAVERAVELRIRWNDPRAERARTKIPAAVLATRKAAVPGLRAPLPAVPHATLPPAAALPAVFVEGKNAPAAWYNYAVRTGALLVAVSDAPPRSDFTTCPFAHVHLAGVPYLLWARGQASGLDAVLSDAALAAGTLAERVHTAAISAGASVGVSLVAEPPDDPLPPPAPFVAPGDPG